MSKVLFGLAILAIFTLNACVGSFSIFGTSSTSLPSTTPEPEQNVACTPSTTLKQLAIYYGWPSSLNYDVHAWNMSLVTADFAQYESIIFGAGLEEPGHGDHANTATIVAAIASTTKTFGYLAIGKTNNYSMAILKDKVDKWAAMTGLAGVFLDEFGFDFADTGVTDPQYRARQKEILDYVHSKGLSVFINAFNSDDVFVKEAGNPLTIQTGDRFLYESYILSWSTRETFNAYRAKVAKLKQAMTAHPGLQIYASSTKGAGTPTNGEIEEQLGVLAVSAIADGFHGVAWTEEDFSPNSLMPKRTLPTFSTTAYCVNGSVTENAGGETLVYSSSAGSVQLNYNSSGNPSYTIQ